jgi:hypothetical protein
MLEICTDLEFKAVPIMVDRCRFRLAILPGDVLTFRGKITSLSDDSAIFDWDVNNRKGKLASTMEITFHMLAVGDLYSEHSKQWALDNYRRLLREAEIKEVPEDKMGWLK